MEYYKVNATSDQVRIAIHHTTGILIANELYTANEIDKAVHKGKITTIDLSKHFTKISIPKSRVFWLFGARFEISN